MKKWLLTLLMTTVVVTASDDVLVAKVTVWVNNKKVISAAPKAKSVTYEYVLPTKKGTYTIKATAIDNTGLSTTATKQVVQ